MKLHDYLHPDFIIKDLDVSNKEELFTALATTIQAHQALDDTSITTDQIFEAIAQREAQVPTGMGEGIAIPHARICGINDVAVILATIKEPIEYDAIDKKPVNIIAFILIPDSQPTKGLKVMAQIARLFTTSFEELKKVENKNEVLEIATNLNLSIEEPLLARDIMVPLPFSVFTDTPLTEITQKMDQFHINGVPILGKDNELLGEITSADLFNIGIPEFFNSLKSVSFVSYFDPFAGYFKQESSSKAEDIMKPVEESITLTSTILEIVYQLVVKKRPTLYVTDENKVVGLIDPNTVMNRIINN